MSTLRPYTIALVVLLILAAASDALAEQTIVFFRHGEKPASGLGQITCQGLNRALALSSLLIDRFGRPDYLYAPDPNVKMADPGGSFFYVRPLATLEPVAIRAGRSVNTNYGYNNIAGIRSRLITASKKDATIFVAWEHKYLQRIVQDIMNRYGGGVTVPAWPQGDYDSLYIVTVDYSSGTPSAQFRREAQGLNGLPTTCPS